ncbi:MAG: hypothetical protein JJ863_17485 [Deltaproteobacteria bacterium]|nr:hypothetical protein [Deltaproteobacteria bacterium]
MPDLTQALEFIGCLTGSAEPASQPMTFQLIDDSRERRGTDAELPSEILHGSLDELSGKLSRANDLGLGIFATVNETDLKGRKKSNITRVRAFFVDADEGEPDVSALPPSMTVRSKAGPHHYWLALGRPELEEFPRLQRQLAKVLGTDPMVNDLPRVMRVPGFMHMKSDPHLVTLEDFDPGRRYSSAQIMNAFPVATPWENESAPQAHEGRIGHILSVLDQVKPRGTGQYTASCPAHHDRHPSLSLTVKDDRVLIHCHAGCSFEEVVEACGLEKHDFFLDADAEEAQQPQEAHYDYRAEDGTLVGRITRRPGKKFAAHRVEDGELVPGLNGLELPLYRLPEVLEGTEEPVFVVEGEKDSDRLIREGLLATTNPFGAGRWRSHHSTSLVGRRVVIIPDNDPAGRRHARDVQRRLRAEGIEAVICELRHPEVSCADASDWLDKGGSVAALRQLAESALVQGQSLPDTIWQQSWAPKELLELGSDIEIARMIADRLTDDHTVFTDGSFWRYDSTAFVPIDPHQLRRKVFEFDGAKYVGARGPIPIRLSDGRTNSIVKSLATMLHRIDFFTSAPRGIACESGFIRFDEDANPRLEPHSPEHRTRHVVPGRWNPGPQAYKHDLLLRLAQGSFRDDRDRRAKYLLFAELLGVVALGLGTRIAKPKAIILWGPAAENGKSMFIETLKGLVPGPAVSALPITALGDTRMIVHLAGKHLNVADELPTTKTIASDVFKAAVTGETLMGRDVYVSALQFRPLAQHVFATNVLPGFRGGMDKGALRRLIVVAFNRKIPAAEQVPHLAEKILTEERDALLSLAVMGARRILRRGEFTVPPSSEEALKGWRHQDDPVVAFLEERATVVLGTQKPFTLTDELYRAFRDHAGDAGYEKRDLPKKPVFAKRVLTWDGRLKSTRKKGQRGIVGIRLRKRLPVSTRQGRFGRGSS